MVQFANALASAQTYCVLYEESGDCDCRVAGLTIPHSNRLLTRDLQVPLSSVGRHDRPKWELLAQADATGDWSPIEDMLFARFRQLPHAALYRQAMEEAAVQISPGGLANAGNDVDSEPKKGEPARWALLHSRWQRERDRQHRR